MRAIISTTIVAVCIIAFASCKKDHNCECYSPNLNSTIKINIHDTKRNAKDACEAQPQTGQYTGKDFQCYLK
ncbi:MAG: hypothetical protein H6551_13430 [Chitinophagales bacterium]|nr:hypothetical protein [Chitinophagales bacterium]